MGDVQTQHEEGGQIITKIDKGRLLQLGSERKTPKTYLTLYLSICTLLGNFL